MINAYDENSENIKSVIGDNLNFLNSNVVDFVSHYTSIKSLSKIVFGKSLRASDYFCMEDKSDGRELLDSLNDIISSNFEKKNIGEKIRIESHVSEKIESLMNNKEIIFQKDDVFYFEYVLKKYIEVTIKNKFNSNLFENNVFVFSLTKINDESDYHWKKFGDNWRGARIEFDARKFFSETYGFSCGDSLSIRRILHCEYIDKLGVYDISLSLLEKMHNEINSHIGKPYSMVVRSWSIIIKLRSSLIKDICYEPEQEIRFLIPLNFNNKNMIVRRYKRFDDYVEFCKLKINSESIRKISINKKYYSRDDFNKFIYSNKVFRADFLQKVQFTEFERGLS